MIFRNRRDCVVASLHGYLLAALSMWQRAVLFIAAILLIALELISSLFGLLVLAAIAIKPGRAEPNQSHGVRLRDKIIVAQGNLLKLFC